MHAVRNIRLCTKDCLCLFVCPTGATDTETGQIDANKCLSGCRLCVDACPSHAISLVPEEFPLQQEKDKDVTSELRSLAASKIHQEKLARSVQGQSSNRIAVQLAKALALSNRLMAEDLIRESGYMLPQSQSAIEFLEGLLKQPQPDDFPDDVVCQLLDSLKNMQPVAPLE